MLKPISSLILRLLPSLCYIPCTDMRVSTKAEDELFEQQWLEKQQYPKLLVILGVDISGVDILRVDILGGTQSNNSWQVDLVIPSYPRLLVRYCQSGLVNTVYQRVWYEKLPLVQFSHLIRMHSRPTLQSAGCPSLYMVFTRLLLLVNIKFVENKSHPRSLQSPGAC